MRAAAARQIPSPPTGLQDIPTLPHYLPACLPPPEARLTVFSLAKSCMEGASQVGLPTYHHQHQARARIGTVPSIVRRSFVVCVVGCPTGWLANLPRHHTHSPGYRSIIASIHFPYHIVRFCLTKPVSETIFLVFRLVFGGRVDYVRRLKIRSRQQTGGRVGE